MSEESVTRAIGERWSGEFGRPVHPQAKHYGHSYTAVRGDPVQDPDGEDIWVACSCGGSWNTAYILDPESKNKKGTTAMSETKTEKAKSKGEQVLAYLKKHPNATRPQIAEAVGCTVQRVGEVLRANGVQAATAPRKAAAPKKAAAKSAGAKKTPAKKAAAAKKA